MWLALGCVYLTVALCVVRGVPVLYTPYFEHPDGTVRRKSGLLTPAFGSSNVLGQFYAQPDFQTLGDSARA